MQATVPAESAQWEKSSSLRRPIKAPLADPDKIKDFLNIAALIATRSPCFALGVVIGLARALVAAAFDLPSIRQLATTSDLVKDLNDIGTLMSADGVFGVRADFDCSKSVLLETGVLLDRLLMAVDNDLVVPYDGVASPHPPSSQPASLRLERQRKSRARSGIRSSSINRKPMHSSASS